VAATEHVTALNKVVMGLLIEPDILRAVPDDGASLIGLAPANALPDDVGARERSRLGMDRVPNIWRVLALNPRYFEATWLKDRVVMAGGALDEATKLAAGLGVSMTNGCRYFIDYYTAAFRRAGHDTGAVLEVAAVVDHYNALNKLADGMQIESDIGP
jgi:AhpD family alkylhydroperoxidase